MGIYGLTSYVAQHQSELLEDFKLHNCPVLVDGNSAASLIYSNLSRSNHAFGGDYDRYARSSHDFVQLLRKCGVTPIFIFDGGYEQRKLRTVLERIRMNIVVCGQYKNKYRESKTFPLMLRDAFRAILRELRVTVVQCDFEADNELVVLSRILGCPLISYDSDFCISDAQYIPFTSIDFKAVRLKKKTSQRKYYLPCKMFSVDKFLSRFGGAVDKCMLPLLSCALGNDYIPRNTFKNFLQLNHMASFEERLKKIVQWMANIVSVEEAVDQMVACVQNCKPGMKKKINHLLADYNRTTCYLLEFIPAEIVEKSVCRALGNLSIINSSATSDHLHESMRLAFDHSDPEASLMDAEDEECTSLSCSDDGIVVLETEEYEISCSDDDEDDTEFLEESRDLDYISNTEEPKDEDESKQTETEDILDNSSAIDGLADDSLLNGTDLETSINNDSACLASTSDATLSCRVPDWFLCKYRQGIITPNLINVINFQRWFIPSQSEDYFSKPSHEISLPVLQAVVGIVLGEIAAVAKIKCHARSKGMHLGVYDITPVFEMQAQPLPSLFSVASIPAEARASILMDCLSLPKNINLGIFPREWRLYVLILMYWKNHCKQPAVNESHIRTVIVCLIYLSVVDPKVGFARLVSDLKRIRKEKKRSDKLSKPSSSSQGVSDDTVHSTDVINDSLHFDTDLLVNSKLQDSLSIDTDQTVSPLKANTELKSDVTSSIGNRPEIIEDSLSVDTSQKSICESLSLVNGDASIIDMDDSAVDRKSLSVPTEDSANELFAIQGGYDSVEDFLDHISEEDCYKSAMALLNYHQVNQTLLKNRKDFDLKLIHSLAQLQHCIQSISILNSVLNFPFLQCSPHLCFSGTFLYNFYSELNHRKLADGYITRTLLAKTGSIIALYRYLISSWEAITSNKVVRPKFDVKKKKKKKNGRSVPVQIFNEPAEPESYRDPDNIYSMLPEE